MPAVIARHRCAVSVPPAAPPLETSPERAAAEAPPLPLSVAAQSPSLPTTQYIVRNSAVIVGITDVCSQKRGVEKNVLLLTVGRVRNSWFTILI